MSKSLTISEKTLIAHGNWSYRKTPRTYWVLFMYFKHYNWFGMSRGDSVMVTTHYERKLYQVGVRYMGQEILEFNGRNVGTYKLHLLLPENEKLKKDRPVEIWISSDKNQYPLLIQTKLPFLGKGTCRTGRAQSQRSNVLVHLTWAS